MKAGTSPSISGLAGCSDLFMDGEAVNLDIAQAGWGEELTIAPNDRYADRIAEARDRRARRVARTLGRVRR